MEDYEQKERNEIRINVEFVLMTELTEDRRFIEVSLDDIEEEDIFILSKN